MSAQRLTGQTSAPEPAAASNLALALEQIAAHAAELDSQPRFPSESFACLTDAGVTQFAADRARCDLRAEARLIRAVAGADASVARILDGHFNGAERVALLAPEQLRTDELRLIGEGAVLLGVWGADPAPGEGQPARIEPASQADAAAYGAVELVLRGVKTFCSGAGGLQRALVVARDERDLRRLAYVDLSRGVAIDRSWYRASGLRASESHRVEFNDTPVLAVLGGADEILREPWFSRDAVRTAATWAGIADHILATTTELLEGRAPDALRLQALGRMRVARATIDRWLVYSVLELERALEQDVDEASDGLLADTRTNGHQWTIDTRANGPARWRSLSVECRIALADAARALAADAALLGGSRGLIGGGALDRARRDLDLFLLQHRLEPKLVELGTLTLTEGPS